MNLVKRILKAIPKFSTQLICAWLFASCLTPIDIPVEHVGNQLVVSGQISPA